MLFVVASVAIHYEVKVVMNPSQQGVEQTMGNIKVGAQAPDFTIPDLAGHPVALSSYRGQKVVLMDFWATWCGPCKMAMPGLQQLGDEFKGNKLLDGTTMKDEIRNSDRAELIFTGSIPDGTLPPGREIEIEATKEGIEIECLVIPWEWIDRARESLTQNDPSPFAHPSPHT